MNRRFPTDVAEMGDIVDLYVEDRLVPTVEIVLKRIDLVSMPFAMNEIRYLREPPKKDWEKRQKQRSKRRSKR